MAASPASAASFASSGRPGPYTIEKTLGYMSGMQANIYSGRVTANSSPASTGTQHVTISWRVWQLVGAVWQLKKTLSTPGPSTKGSTSPPAGLSAYGLPGTYSTDLTITWKTATGVFLGQVYRDYIDYGDYQCWGTGCGIGWAGNQYSIWLG